MLLFTSYMYNFPFSFPFHIESEVFQGSKWKFSPWAGMLRANSRCIRKFCWVWMGSGVRSSTLSINHNKLLWQAFTAMTGREVWPIWNMSFKYRDWGLWPDECTKMYMFRCFLLSSQLVIHGEGELTGLSSHLRKDRDHTLQTLPTC